MKGTVPGYGEVLYFTHGIVNILSLAHIAKNRLVTFDTNNWNQFEVTKDDGSILKQSEHGLYYYDMKLSRDSTWQGHRPSRGNGSNILFNNVAENKTKYTVSDY
jgi:hypothetical protein